MNEHFLEHMKQDSKTFMERLKDCPKEELYLVTPKYLVPYLDYIQKHKRLFRTVICKARMLQLDNSYRRMFQHVFTPILERYGVPVEDRQYMMSFYIHGMMAVITEWLKKDCSDPVEHVITVIRQCVRKPED